MPCFFFFFSGNCIGDRCHRNSSLRLGKSLKSSNGKYKLVLKTYGNLELICETLGSLWSTNTINYDTDLFYLTKSGYELVLRGKHNTTIWRASYKGYFAEYVILQDDGNLVLYNKNDNAIWSTVTCNKCRGKYKKAKAFSCVLFFSLTCYF